MAYADALVAAWPGGTGDRLRIWWISHRVAKWDGKGVVGERTKFQAPERMFFGRDVIIGSGSFFAAAGSGTLMVGDRVSFNTNVHVNASVGGTIRIGDNCLVGPNVVLRSADHRFDRTDIPIRDQGHRCADIVIEDDVWLGANVTVVGGERVSKYEFGMRLATAAGFSAVRVTRGSIAGTPLIAPRPRDMSLSSEKTASTLGYRAPDCGAGLSRFLADRGRALEDRVAKAGSSTQFLCA